MIKLVRGLGMALGLVAIIAATLAVFGLPVIDSLQRILEGALGSEQGIARSFVKTTPLLLTGLGTVVAWRAGMFNIGCEGQFVVGGLCGAAIFKLAPSLPPQILNLSILVATALGGALYAGLAGFLHVKRGVQVVISTILLNFISIQALDWAASGPLQEAKHQLPQTDLLPDAAMLARFSVRHDFHVGVILAWFVAVAVAAWLFRTRSGFLTRLAGENPRVLRSNRISPDGIQIRSMLISGALSGLAGGIEYTALVGQIGRSFAQDWGFLGIPVALLGGLHPIGVLGSSFFFGALFAGTEHLSRFASGSSSIIFVIQSLAVLLVLGVRRRFAAR